MSGLFTRLAKQNLGRHRQADISVASRPLFKTDSFEGQRGEVGSVEAQDSMPVGEPVIPIQDDSKNNTMSPAMTITETVAGHSGSRIEPVARVSCSKSGLKNSTPEIFTEIDGEEKTPHPTALEPTLTQTYQTQPEGPIERESSLSQKPIDDDESDTGQVSITPKMAAKSGHTDSTQFSPTKNNSTALPVRTVSERSPQLSEPGTTVNVTIGRIVVKAVTEEGKKTPVKKQKSQRQPLMSLDDYQAKRQRGER